jgi:hypothetical protein
MVCRDLVSTRNRNNSLYGRRSNVRTTFTNQDTNNTQNNTLSYIQALTGIPADAKSNNHHNSTERTTQLATFLSEFRNIFSQPHNMFSQLLNMFSQLLNMFSQPLNMFSQLLNMFSQPLNMFSQTT